MFRLMSSSSTVRVKLPVLVELDTAGKESKAKSVPVPEPPAKKTGIKTDESGFPVVGSKPVEFTAAAKINTTPGSVFKSVNVYVHVSVLPGVPVRLASVKAKVMLSAVSAFAGCTTVHNPKQISRAASKIR